MRWSLFLPLFAAILLIGQQFRSPAPAAPIEQQASLSEFTPATDAVGLVSAAPVTAPAAPVLAADTATEMNTQLSPNIVEASSEQPSEDAAATAASGVGDAVQTACPCDCADCTCNNQTAVADGTVYTTVVTTRYGAFDSCSRMAFHRGQPVRNACRGVAKVGRGVLYRVFHPFAGLRARRQL